MAYELLKDKYHVSGIYQLGVPLGFGLRYDPTNGDYELKQLGLGGSYDVGIGLAKLYYNGDWTSDALKDPKLFVDGDKDKPTPLAQDLSADMRKKVYAAYLTKGGSTKGVVVNNSARPQHQNDKAGVGNNFPGTNPGIATAIPGLGGLAAPDIKGIIDALEPGLKDIANLNFKSKNEKDLFSGDSNAKLLIYPGDVLKDKQDTLHITMYRYKAPLGDTFLQRDADGNAITVDTASIFTKGLQRNTALKEFIGTTILPIPSGIQDNNAISWGDDQMNNMTAAVAAYTIGSTGQALAGQLLTGTGGAVANTAGIQLPIQSINNIATLIAAGASANNPMIKTAITSLLLKNAGFEISPETILARGAGIVPNSNMELLFQGPTLRQFGFTWRMSPRSKLEARNIKRIIRFFKQGSAPRKLDSQSGSGAASLFLGTPNVFKLSYKTEGNKEISGLNKFKICALVGMNVVYAPDGQWAAYDEGQPVSLTMSLNFQEIEPVYESDYQEDGPLIKSKDNPEVYPDDVGY
jgi:hypothetical protein